MSAEKTISNSWQSWVIMLLSSISSVLLYEEIAAVKENTHQMNDLNVSINVLKTKQADDENTLTDNKNNINLLQQQQVNDVTQFSNIDIHFNNLEMKKK